MPEFDELISEAAADCRRRGLSPHTLIAYKRIWMDFLIWSIDCSKTSPKDLTDAQAREYLARACEGKKPKSSALIQTGISYLYRLKDWKNPFAHIERPTTKAGTSQIKYLTVPQVNLLLAHLSENTTYEGKLCFTVAAIFYRTAARFSSILQIKLFDLVKDSRGDVCAFRLKLKNQKYADKHVSPQLRPIIREWMELLTEKKNINTFRSKHSMDFCRSEYLFPGPKGKPYTNQAFNARLKAACKALRIPVISSHGFRHSAATALLNVYRRNIREVQSVLNHESIISTMIYTNITKDQESNTLDEL